MWEGPVRLLHACCAAARSAATGDPASSAGAHVCVLGAYRRKRAGRLGCQTVGVELTLVTWMALFALALEPWQWPCQSSGLSGQSAFVVRRCARACKWGADVGRWRRGPRRCKTRWAFMDMRLAAGERLAVADWQTKDALSGWERDAACRSGLKLAETTSLLSHAAARLISEHTGHASRYSRRSPCSREKRRQNGTITASAHETLTV
jgi:hypothetical protein